MALGSIFNALIGSGQGHFTRSTPIMALRLLSSIRGNFRLNRLAARFYSDEQTQGETQLTKVLKDKFPGATFINVSDISGGCGSMYEVQIEASEFQGKRTVLQHRLVNEALKAEIKDMHGLRISTAVPSSSGS